VYSTLPDAGVVACCGLSMCCYSSYLLSYSSYLLSCSSYPLNHPACHGCLSSSGSPSSRRSSGLGLPSPRGGRARAAGVARCQYTAMFGATKQRRKKKKARMACDERTRSTGTVRMCHQRQPGGACSLALLGSNQGMRPTRTCSICAEGEYRVCAGMGTGGGRLQSDEYAGTCRARHLRRTYRFVRWVRGAGDYSKECGPLVNTRVCCAGPCVGSGGMGRWAGNGRLVLGGVGAARVGEGER